MADNKRVLSTHGYYEARAFERADGKSSGRYLDKPLPEAPLRCATARGGIHTSIFFALQREEPVEERPFRAVKSDYLEKGL
jgi:hypothetical protein